VHGNVAEDPARTKGIDREALCVAPRHRSHSFASDFFPTFAGEDPLPELDVLFAVAVNDKCDDGLFECGNE